MDTFVRTVGKQQNINPYLGKQQNINPHSHPPYHMPFKMISFCLIANLTPFLKLISLVICVNCNGNMFQFDIALYITVFFMALVLGKGSVKRPIKSCLVL